MTRKKTGDARSEETAYVDPKERYGSILGRMRVVMIRAWHTLAGHPLVDVFPDEEWCEALRCDSCGQVWYGAGASAGTEKNLFEVERVSARADAARHARDG